MIEIEIQYEENNIVKLNVTGHADYDEHGRDIVCAGISVLLETLHLVMDSFRFDKTLFSIKKDTGYFMMECAPELSAQYAVQLIIGTIIMGLSGVQASYPDYVSITTKEE